MHPKDHQSLCFASVRDRNNGQSSRHLPDHTPTTAGPRSTVPSRPRRMPSHPRSRCCCATNPSWSTLSLPGQQANQNPQSPSSAFETLFMLRPRQTMPDAPAMLPTHGNGGQALQRQLRAGGAKREPAQPVEHLRDSAHVATLRPRRCQLLQQLS